MPIHLGYSDNVAYLTTLSFFFFTNVSYFHLSQRYKLMLLLPYNILLIHYKFSPLNIKKSILEKFPLQESYAWGKWNQAKWSKFKLKGNSSAVISWTAYEVSLNFHKTTYFPRTALLLKGILIDISSVILNYILINLILLNYKTNLTDNMKRYELES